MRFVGLEESMSRLRWYPLLVVGIACFLAVPATGVEKEASAKTATEADVKSGTAEMVWIFAMREVIARQERTHPETGETAIRRRYESVFPGNLYLELGVIFDEARIVILPAEDFDPSIEDQFQESFLKHDSLSKQDRKMAYQAAQEMDVPFMGYGLVEVRMPEEDPESKQFSVTVEMSAKVLDIRKRLARVVGNSSRAKFRGVGADRAKARDRALLHAIEATAEKLLQQLNRKGIP